VQCHLIPRSAILAREAISHPRVAVLNARFAMTALSVIQVAAVKGRAARQIAHALNVLLGSIRCLDWTIIMFISKCVLIVQLGTMQRCILR
jgi:hypothetical protein